MSRILIYKITQELDHDIEAVWSMISKFDAIAAWSPMVVQCTTEGEGIGSIRSAVTDSGGHFNEKLEILDHESHTISYSFEEPVPFPATGICGTQHLDAIAPGKTLFTWTAEAESIDGEAKDTVCQQTQDLVKITLAGLVQLLEKR
ncbi:bet V I allergen [Fusarium mexicanum]|uniref:Bet V I allergen n=1 Tax=Fusarium mexicanum TaxID=751941 RepID=A0A8H5INK3_9HYPO|nr:bet V I allergen [Fusarium mexicanum]